MNMFHSSLLGRVLAGALVFAGCGPVGAAWFRVEVGAASGGGSDSKVQTSSTGLSLSALSSHGRVAGGIDWSLSASETSTASGSAGPGFFQLSATVFAESATVRSQGPAFGQASAGGQLRDSFVISASDCAACTPDTLGYLQFAVVFDGDKSANGFASFANPSPGGQGGSFDTTVSWNSDLIVLSDSVTGVGLTASSLKQNANGDILVDYTTGAGLGRHVLGMEFYFGRPISLQWSSSVTAQAGVASLGTELSFSGQASAVVDFSNTFAWDGITGLLDANGNPVASFSAFSPDGVSYLGSLAPVPEPGALALMLIGLAGLGLRRRIQPRPFVV